MQHQPVASKFSEMLNKITFIILIQLNWSLYSCYWGVITSLQCLVNHFSAIS